MAKDDKRIITINYTNREFQSIREDLIQLAERFYPDTFRDFSEASFGSLMLDTVAYVGDQLSFYLDYQANESYLNTAIEYGNIVKHAVQLGYRYQTETRPFHYSEQMPGDSRDGLTSSRRFLGLRAELSPQPASPTLLTAPTMQGR